MTLYEEKELFFNRTLKKSIDKVYIQVVYYI